MVYDPEKGCVRKPRLPRDTSTPDNRAWWDAVDAAAATPTLQEALAEIQRLRADNEKLRGFAQAVLDNLTIESEWVAEVAIDHRLLERQPGEASRFRPLALLTGGKPDAD